MNQTYNSVFEIHSDLYEKFDHLKMKKLRGEWEEWGGGPNNVYTCK
jgi:hypothetical protein